MKHFNKLVIIITALCLAYTFKIQPLYDIMLPWALHWNDGIDYVLNFRNKEPFLFMCIPIAIMLLWLKED